MLDIKNYVKGIQTFNDWIQYDIKELSASELSNFIYYLKNNYNEVYPCIQKFDNKFIGDIQVHEHKFIDY